MLGQVDYKKKVNGRNEVSIYKYGWRFDSKTLAASFLKQINTCLDPNVVPDKCAVARHNDTSINLASFHSYFFIQFFISFRHFADV